MVYAAFYVFVFLVMFVPNVAFFGAPVGASLIISAVGTLIVFLVFTYKGGD